ncbi:MAG: TonB family protein [Elusimicrobia bacterium]|nr:TonB family protein [Elusimicrobiota bacterium]
MDEPNVEWRSDIPFYLIAAAAHSALLMLNPTIQWKTPRRAIAASVPVEFVARLPAPPAPSPRLAPAPPPSKEIGRGGSPRRAVQRRWTAKPSPAAEAARQRRAARAASQAAARAAAQAAARKRRRERALAVAAAAAQQRETTAKRAAALAAEREARARRKILLAQALAQAGGPAEAAGAAEAGALPGAEAATVLAESPEPGDGTDGAADGRGTAGGGEGVSWAVEGPTGSRRALRREAPISPAWVGERGLDLTVAVRFQVLADGSIKGGAVIRKTSGYPELDRRALAALSHWRFEPAAAGGPPVWGRASFRFAR